jgi:hypothetical protein
MRYCFGPWRCNSSPQERRLEPDFQYLPGEGFLCFGAAQNQDIGVVVLAAAPRAVEVVHQRRANPREFVSDDAHADATGADQQPALRVALRDAQRNRPAEVRIVHRLCSACAAVGNGDTLGAQNRNEVIFEVHASMIAADSNHRAFLREHSFHVNGLRGNKQNRRAVAGSFHGCCD